MSLSLSHLQLDGWMDGVQIDDEDTPGNPIQDTINFTLSSLQHYIIVSLVMHDKRLVTYLPSLLSSSFPQ